MTRTRLRRTAAALIVSCVLVAQPVPASAGPQPHEVGDKVREIVICMFDALSAFTLSEPDMQLCLNA